MGIINKDLLVAKTVFTKSKSSGSVCSMELLRKDAFIPKKVIPKKEDVQDNLGWLD